MANYPYYSTYALPLEQDPKWQQFLNESRRIGLDNPNYYQQPVQTLPDQTPLIAGQNIPTGEKQPFDMNNAAGQAMNAFGAGMGGYAQGVQGTDRFSVDPFAGYVGSAQGMASGGVVGAIAGGIGAQVGTFSEVNKNLKGLQTGVNLTQTSATGQPLYAGGAYTEAAQNIEDLNAGEKAITGSLDPATRVFSGLFGTRKRIRKKRGQLEGNLQKAQQEFNRADVNYDQQLASREAYRKRRDMSNRLYNLYSTPSQRFY